MILAEKVRKSFGPVEAVRGVSFDIPSGQIVGLLGPNGAGKSTTIRMLAGLLPPDDGRVAIDGQDSLDHSMALRKRLGYLPENNPLYPEMRVETYLRSRAELHGVARRERRSAIDRAVETCRLSDVRRRRIGALSKGYRQRVGLAAALLHDPPVLLLDEPTSGLDPSQIIETRSLLRSLGGRHTVILSSHILPEVEKTCERLIIIARGRVLADGNPGELAQRHASGVVLIEAKSSDPEALERIVRTAPGVAGVSAERVGDGWIRLRVTPRAGDVREAAAQAVVSSGARVREVRRENDGLEALFSTLIERATTEGER